MSPCINIVNVKTPIFKLVAPRVGWTFSFRALSLRKENVQPTRGATSLKIGVLTLTIFIQGDTLGH